AVRVHLEVECQLVEVGADRVARDAAVLVHALDLVAALSAAGERGGRTLAHAADARRGDDLVAGGPPGDHRRSLARASSSSRLLSAGSSTTASRSSWRIRPSCGPGRKPTSIRSLPSTARSRSR